MNGYLIDSNQRIVYYDTSEIQITNKEFDLLSYFVKNKNNLVSRDQILYAVWGDDYFGSDRVVDDTIRRLMKKLGNIMLETVYGYGYKLVEK